ncbi:MAG: ribonuclease E/G, partial [Candidatus Sumerlaeota bacterium]
MTIVKKRVLINVEDKDIRVAILEDDQLAQLFIEQIEERSIVGNMYNARVEGIVPGLQAAFVNIGLDRNAFLHFSDIADCYSLPDSGAAQQSNGKSGSPQKHSSSKGGKTPLQLGQEILVQALKEPISTKGARVTMNASIPGRFLVYLPTSNEKSGGVSRRIESASERRRLRSILKSLDSETGSFIIRTAGLSQDQDAIESDVEKLKQRWERICEKGEKQGAP